MCRGIAGAGGDSRAREGPRGVRGGPRRGLEGPEGCPPERGPERVQKGGPRRGAPEGGPQKGGPRRGASEGPESAGQGSPRRRTWWCFSSRRRPAMGLALLYYIILYYIILYDMI